MVIFLFNTISGISKTIFFTSFLRNVFISYVKNFEPTLLVKCVIEVKLLSFSPFQGIFSYNYIEFL